MRIIFLILVLLAFPRTALAERVVEVQNIKVAEAQNRDEAVLKATRDAATQVWEQLNPGKPVPEFTNAQLDGMASYVDVTSEVIRPNFYAATFNLGIRSSAVSLDAYEPDATPQMIDTNPVTEAGERKPPSWVLVVPAREADGSSKLWDVNDAWAQAWVRAPAGRVPTAAPQADPKDAQLLPSGKLGGNEIELNSSLVALAQKYTAPAVALVLLQSPRAAIAAGDELTVEVLYTRADGSEQASAQSSIFVNTGNAANPIGDAVTEAIRQLGDLALGPLNSEPADPIVTNPMTAAAVLPVAGQPGLSSTYTANTSGGLALHPSPAGNKVSVRIPLSSPADLATYRRKIDNIPGAHFEITSLNRTFVEGNIVYSGDQGVLMQKLAESGLRQQ
jgi:hypothetical protein